MVSCLEWRRILETSVVRGVMKVHIYSAYEEHIPNSAQAVIACSTVNRHWQTHISG